VYKPKLNIFLSSCGMPYGDCPAFTELLFFFFFGTAAVVETKLFYRDLYSHSGVPSTGSEICCAMRLTCLPNLL
jgi:hypothetical protein